MALKLDNLTERYGNTASEGTTHVSLCIRTVIWILREEREDQGRSLLESLEVEQKLGPKGTRFLHGHNNLESSKKPVYSIPMNRFETNSRKEFINVRISKPGLSD
jgi:hypothetical protein